MRIFYLCYEDLNEPRGGVIHVLEVVKNLAALGHHIELFTPRSPGNWELSEIIVREIPTPSLRIVNWISFYILSAFFLFFLSLRHRPDAFYVREMGYNLFPQIVARMLNIPLILEVNALISNEMRMIGTRPWKLLLSTVIQRFYLTCSDHILAVSQGIKDVLIQGGRLAPEKITVVSNGTNPDLFRPLDEEECRQKVGLKSAIPLVGFVGSCYPYHDIDTLIDCAPIVLKHHSVKFIIAGEGSMRKIWMERVKEKGLDKAFSFPGAIPYKDVPLYINAFTCCVALFKRESERSPMKLYDYMACGKAVISSDIKGVDELLRESQAGIVIEPENPQALAQAILVLIENNQLREEMGRNGREAVVANYTWRNTAIRISQTFEALHEDARGKSPRSRS